MFNFIKSVKPTTGDIFLTEAELNDQPNCLTKQSIFAIVMQLHHEPAVLIVSRQALPTLDRKELQKKFGFSAETIVATAKEVLSKVT